MWTGLRVFGRETVSDSIAAILGQEPDWKALPADLPNRIEHLLRRCLTKDPRRRLHDIADARIEIEDILAAPQDTGATDRQAASIASRRGPSGWLPWALLAVATIALFVVSALALKRNSGTGVTEGTPVKFTLLPPGVVTFTPAGNFVAFSPDGLCRRE